MSFEVYLEVLRLNTEIILLYIKLTQAQSPFEWSGMSMPASNLPRDDDTLGGGQQTSYVLCFHSWISHTTSSNKNSKYKSNARWMEGPQNHYISPNVQLHYPHNHILKLNFTKPINSHGHLTYSILHSIVMLSDLCTHIKTSDFSELVTRIVGLHRPVNLHVRQIALCGQDWDFVKMNIGEWISRSWTNHREELQ